MPIEYKIEWPRKPGVLTPEYLEEVTKHIEKVGFHVIGCDGLVHDSKTYPGKFWRITIDSYMDEKEQIATFIHELIHVAFFVCGSFGKNKDLEDFVEEEAQKFYKEHPDFARSLFERLAGRVKHKDKVKTAEENKNQLSLPL